MLFAATCPIPIYVNSIFGYLPATAVILGVAGSYVYTRIISAGMAFEETSDISVCTKGEETELSVRVINKSPLIITNANIIFSIRDIFGNDNILAAMNITMGGKEERNFDFSCRFDHVGVYKAGLKEIVMSDMFGLFRKKAVNNSLYNVTVVPAVYELSNMELSTETLSESRKMITPVLIDGFDYSGVREYIIGDPIKKIHWKLSARTDNYMTRIYETYGNPGVSVIYDFSSPGYDAETMMSIYDGIVETGVALCRFAQKTGMEHEIIYIDKEGFKATGTVYENSDLPNLTESLPVINSTKAASAKALKLLEETGMAMYSLGNIAICTGSATAEMIDMLISIKNRGRNPLLILIIPKELTENERRNITAPLRALDDYGIGYYAVYSCEQLKEGVRV